MVECLDALAHALIELRFRCVPIPSRETSVPWRREFPGSLVSLHIPIRGRTDIDVPNPKWLHPLEPGEVLLVDRGVAGGLRAKDEDDTVPKVFSTGVAFDAPHGHPLLDGMPEVIQAAPTGKGTRSFGFLLEAVLAELMYPTIACEAVVPRLCEALFVEVLRHHLIDFSWDETGWLRALGDPAVRSGLDASRDVQGNPIPLRDVSRSSGRSRRRFGARLRQFAGLTPSEYLLGTRIRRAARLLRDGETDLSKIAHLTGYGSRPSFCRAFKRELGLSPAQYWRSVHHRRFPRQERASPPSECELDSGCPGRCEVRFASEEEAEAATTRSGEGADPSEPE
jgi:AraC-like DNA-binding protein